MQTNGSPRARERVCIAGVVGVAAQDLLFGITSKSFFAAAVADGGVLSGVVLPAFTGAFGVDVAIASGDLTGVLTK